MKRYPIFYDKRFNDPDFAQEYIARHIGVSIKLAEKISGILQMKNFENGKILDTGCGSGFTLIQLAKKFPFSECYGIDLSDTLLETANDWKQKEKIASRVTFINADVQDIPFPENYFSVVININMLHLIPDPVRMLNEIERVLQPEGFFFISDLKRSILGILEKEMKSAFTPEEVKDIIAESNIPLGQFSTDIISWKYQSV